MNVGEDVWEGALFRVDSEVYDTVEEELLIAMEVTRTGGWTHIHWLWLTGPDAGTSFVGQMLRNQQLGVTRIS